MVETSVAATWVYSVMHGDTEPGGLVDLGVSEHIYEDSVTDASENGPTKYILFSVLSSNDKMGVGSARLGSDIILQIKGVAQCESYGGDLGAIAARMDALLHANKGTVTGGKVFAAVRLGEIRYSEKPQDVEYRHLGGRWKLLAQSS